MSLFQPKEWDEPCSQGAPIIGYRVQCSASVSIVFCIFGSSIAKSHLGPFILWARLPGSQIPFAGTALILPREWMKQSLRFIGHAPHVCPKLMSQTRQESSIMRASVCGTGMHGIHGTIPLSCGLITGFRACESLSGSDSLYSSLRLRLVKSSTNQSFHRFTMARLWFVSFTLFHSLCFSAIMSSDCLFGPKRITSKWYKAGLHVGLTFSPWFLNQIGKGFSAKAARRTWLVVNDLKPSHLYFFRVQALNEASTDALRF